MKETVNSVEIDALLTECRAATKEARELQLVSASQRLGSRLRATARPIGRDRCGFSVSRVA